MVISVKINIQNVYILSTCLYKHFPHQHTPELFVLQLGDPCIRVYVALLCSFVKFPLRLMLVKFIHIIDQCDALVSVMDVEPEEINM